MLLETQNKEKYDVSFQHYYNIEIISHIFERINQ